MKLINARVQNYRSVEDSGKFEVGDLTCLVGKNEAGKTALLSALKGFNPTDKFAYDRVKDLGRTGAFRSATSLVLKLGQLRDSNSLPLIPP